MRTANAIRLIVISATLAMVLSSPAPAEDCLTLTPVKNATFQDLAGSTHKLYVEPDGKGWIVLFKSAEVAAKNELGNFNGVWLPDDKTSSLKVFRFDTEEGLALSLFTSPQVTGLVLGYRSGPGGSWRFLFPERTLLEKNCITLASLKVRE
jgi:hypothetical protein